MGLLEPVLSCRTGLSHYGLSLHALMMEFGRFRQWPAFQISESSANSGTLSAILHLAIRTCERARTSSGQNNVRAPTN